MLLGFRPSLGSYVDAEGIVRNDDGTMAVAMEDPIATSTAIAPTCDPNFDYPHDHVCYQLLRLRADVDNAAKAKSAPCLGTPVVKGISNCTLLGVAAAVAVVFMMRD